MQLRISKSCSCYSFRPFTCSYCDNKYYRKNALSAHEAKCPARLAQEEKAIKDSAPQSQPVMVNQIVSSTDANSNPCLNLSEKVTNSNQLYKPTDHPLYAQQTMREQSEA